MIDEQAYKKIRQYAKALCNANDWEDIANETCILFLKNPTEVSTNKFWMTLVRRAKYKYYFNTNTKQLKYQDAVVENYEELTSTIPEENTLDNVVFLHEFRAKAAKANLPKEQELLCNKILKGEEWSYEDRGNLHLLKLSFRKILI